MIMRDMTVEVSTTAKHLGTLVFSHNGRIVCRLSVKADNKTYIDQLPDDLTEEERQWVAALTTLSMCTPRGNRFVDKW